MPIDQEASGVDLHLASRSGDVQVIRSLVQNPGVDLDARDILGDSGLLKAARYGHTEVVEALLVAGADKNAQDNNGWTSLHISIANNREGVFFALLSAGHESAPINIEAVTSSGETPLHMAAYHGQEWAIDTLLRLGANRHAVNYKQQWPLQVARHNTVRSMLRSSMAPGERGFAAVSAGAIDEAAHQAGRTQDYALEQGGVLKEVSSVVEGDVRTGDNHHGDVQGRAEKRRVHDEGVRRLSSDAMPLDEDVTRRRQQGILKEKHHGDALLLLSTKEKSTTDDTTEEEETLESMINNNNINCFVGNLGSTEASETEGNSPIVLELKGGPLFEEGSSEGEYSQDSGGELL